MCEKTKIISRVKNGELSMCRGCKNYSLVFNNILFQFDESQLNAFKEYVSKINIEYWLDFSSYTAQRRKIPVQTFNQNLVLVFDYHEINEIKKLLGITEDQNEETLYPYDIDYNLIFN